MAYFSQLLFYMAENVAIPILDDEIAPCFEVAHCFIIAEIGEGGRLSKSVRKCGGCEGYGRIRFLIDEKIDVLICGGIKQFYRDLLNISGIAIIPDIVGSAETALANYLSGRLIPQKAQVDSEDLGPEIPQRPGLLDSGAFRKQRILGIAEAGASSTPGRPGGGHRLSVMQEID